MQNLSPVRIGIIAVSDRASAGVYPDQSGPATMDLLNKYITQPWEPVYKVIPDEKPLIMAVLIEMTENNQCSLILTTGGTGPALRDVTPEATQAVCEKLLPGFGEAMRAASLTHIKTAILSRQTAGVRGRTLIINLPGSPKAIKECLDVILPAVPDCLKLIGAKEITFDAHLVKGIKIHH